MKEGQLDRLADTIAERVIERVGEFLERRPLTTAEAAEMLGRTPAWVRRHADELGAVRLTDGPRPRLHFPAAEVERRRNRG
jgi:hypothetical protein